jgi:hypothetical protein
MIKKIALLAIIIMIFIGGNLIASDEPTPPDLHVWVWAQDQLEWTLNVEGFTPITDTGNWDDIKNEWAFCDYEVWVLGDLHKSGTFPWSGHYDIEITIIIPAEEDPEE